MLEFLELRVVNVKSICSKPKISPELSLNKFAQARLICLLQINLYKYNMNEGNCLQFSQNEFLNVYTLYSNVVNH